MVIEEIAKTLHNEFPEYKRKKFAVFKTEVENIVLLEKKRCSSTNGADCSPTQNVSSDAEDIDIVDDELDSTTIKSSLNKTLSELYSNNLQSSSNSTSVCKPNKLRKIELNEVNRSPNRNATSLFDRQENSISQSSKEAEMIDLSNDDAPSNHVPEDYSVASTPLKNSAHRSNLTNGKTSLPASAARLPNKMDTSTITHSGKLKSKSFARRKIGPVESKTTFADLGGMDSVLIKVLDLLLHLKHPEIYRYIGVTPPRGFLLHGPPGCGKTLLANAIAGQLKLPLIKLAATEIVSGVSGESESKLRDLFEEATSNAPCILFIDEIDAITQRRDHAHKGMESRIVGQLLACMDDLNEKKSTEDSHVVVIGATNRPDTLDPALRRAGRFEREISLGIPDEKSRSEILKVLTAKLNTNIDLNLLARKCPGYVGADMSSLCREAATIAVNRIFKQLQTNAEIEPLNDNQNIDVTKQKLNFLLNWLDNTTPLSSEDLSSVSIDMSDFESALKLVQPSAKREGFATVPGVTWDDIGALNDVREELELSILAPVNHPEVTKALGLESPSGILLCGPPGCGKTLLAKAVANQAGINFISVKGPELLNMYVGESERAVRQVFQRARNSAPCVIFFDEIDALCPRRSSSSGGENSARVVNQILTEMDGLECRGQGVFVMGATNRVDILDPAVLRPGRLQKILFVDLPSPSDRVDILRAITRHGTRPKLAPDVDFDALAHSEECEFFTGADMAALVTEASNASFKEHIVLSSRRGKRQSEVSSNLDIKVSAKHFRMAFSKVRPSVSIKDRKRYQDMKNLYSTSTAVESTKPAAIEMSCDEDEIESDLVIPSDRERSLSQAPFDDTPSRDDQNTEGNAFSTKDSVESDLNEIEDNREQATEQRDVPIQQECDSSPNNLGLESSAQSADMESSQTPSPLTNNRGY